MKKIIAMVLCLVLLLSLVGCGEKKEDVVVGGDTCPAITVDGVTYFDTGKAMPVEPDESVIVYEEIPIEGGSTTESITAYAILEKGKTAVCLINHEWYEFAVK